MNRTFTPELDAGVLRRLEAYAGPLCRGLQPPAPACLVRGVPGRAFAGRRAQEHRAAEPPRHVACRFAGHQRSRPGLRQFVSQSSWNEALISRRYRARMARTFADPAGVFVLDDTTFPKAGPRQACPCMSDVHFPRARSSWRRAPSWRRPPARTSVPRWSVDARDVLEVCHRPYHPARPQVCLDKASKQLLAEVRAPLPINPEKSSASLAEYTRPGTASLFMVCEPFAGRRHVFVRAQRKRPDFAAVVKTLCDELYPRAAKIVLVMDQLNPHGVASLSAAFPPPEARRLAERLEIRHTPKHGSWLNMAEIELSALARQCLAERMDNQQHLTKEVAAWELARNTAATRLDWRFTTADARVKLQHLSTHKHYPAEVLACTHTSV